MQARRCPSCGSATVLEGRILPQGDSNGIGFQPSGITYPLLSLGVDVPATSDCCLACGLIWTKVAPEKLLAYAQNRGGELLREHLQVLKLGPAHDLPDCPEARRAGEAVAEINVLVLGGRGPEATRRYRELLGVKWDQAIDDVRGWQKRSRAERLAMFGWPLKSAEAADEKATSGHPMHDAMLDGP